MGTVRAVPRFCELCPGIFLTTEKRARKNLRPQDPITLIWSQTFRRNLLLSRSHLLLGIPTDLFPSGFPHQKPRMHTFSPPRVLHYPTISSLFTARSSSWQLKPQSSWLRSFLLLLPLGPNIFLNILFSNILGLCSSLNVRYQVSHPNKKQTEL